MRLAIDTEDRAALMEALPELTAAARAGERLRLEATLAHLIPSYVTASVQRHVSA